MQKELQLTLRLINDATLEIHHIIFACIFSFRVQWETWLVFLREEKNACQEETELLVRTINLSGGYMTHDEILFDADYENLSNLTNKVCGKRNELQNDKVRNHNNHLLIFFWSNYTNNKLFLSLLYQSHIFFN